MAAPGNQPIWFRVFPPEAEQNTPFHGDASGPIRMPARDSPPILYFYLLFSLDLMKEFVKQTNRPRRELSVDETLVGTKGKTAMLQYIPSKRSRFGIKFWVLAEAVTGYVLQMHIYLGKTFEPALPAGTLQGTNVVIKLLQSADLLNKWYHVFTDNFFSSLNLARTLLVQRTHLTGTLRKNRPMPNMIKNANPDPGQTTYARQGNILLCSFRDQNRRKQVKLVSTFYSAIRAMNAKPLIVNAYNNFMGGVDLSDQMMAFYNDHRKQTKVWKKIILHMFHRILLNSYILYYQHTSHNPILTRFEFVKQVIEGLTEEHLSNRQQNPGQRQKNTKGNGKERKRLYCVFRQEKRQTKKSKDRVFTLREGTAQVVCS
ncbi:unnamed protein product [Mytilus edulis]|uniref:PiggyBac transposable element-derived protein domain-containing protein n=1 Tax=Mytilus edulis TaxID=6550 RepID=A0A8S3SWF0_MYTED|nr:unnamed protein product [Mytilus edulis]